MNLRERVETGQKCGRIDEACKRYGLGESSMRRLADEIGAVVRVGRVYLVNFDLMDRYMDEKTGKS